MGRVRTIAQSEAYHVRERRRMESKEPISNRPQAIINAYPYKSLDSEKHEIRLLKLGYPPTIDAAVNFSLFHFSLDHNDTLAAGKKCQYDALSYTWSDWLGSSDRNATILIDGHEVAVTSNLAAALGEIFHHDEKKLIWVDAVCINQSNTNERNHQVSEMKMVYEKATRVITWLGEEYGGSEMAFKFFRSVLKRGVRKTMSKSWIPRRNLRDIQDEAYAVMKLFSRDYWRRIWVLQELRVAKDVLVCVGHETIGWRDLQRVQALLWEHSVMILDVLEGTQIGHMCARLWQDGPNIVEVGQSSETIDARLGDMLVKHRRKAATEPRDKVFAILGLCDGHVKQSIAVNYDLETSTVLLEATRFVIEQEKDLLILADNKDRSTIEKMGFIQLSNPHSSSDWSDSTPDLTLTTLDLPSWVPNFALPPTRQKSRISDWCQHFPPSMTETLQPRGTSTKAFEQSTGLYVSAAGSTKVQASILPDTKMLSVAGVKIGTVTEVSETMPNLEPGEFRFWPVYKILRAWFLTFRKNGGTSFEGQGGLLDIVLLGALYKGDVGKKERDSIVTGTLKDLKLLARRYLPTEAEEQFQSLLDSVEVEQKPKPKKLHAAEVNIFGVIHRCKERTLLVLSSPELEFAIGPECVEVGDLIVVLSGCAIPIVLRKREGENSEGWRIIGDAYVNKFMDGKAVDEVALGKRTMETFNIY